MEVKYNDKNELEIPIYKDIDQTIDLVESIFSDWGDIVKKRFELQRTGETLSMYITYIDGLVDNEMVERTVTRPLLYEWRGKSDADGKTYDSTDDKTDGSADDSTDDRTDGSADDSADDRTDGSADYGADDSTDGNADDSKDDNTNAGTNDNKDDGTAADDNNVEHSYNSLRSDMETENNGKRDVELKDEFCRIFHVEIEAVDIVEVSDACLLLASGVGALVGEGALYGLNIFVRVAYACQYLVSVASV